MISWDKHITVLGRGRPLVFFHGWGFDSTIWHYIAQSLQEKFTIYLVDLPGSGTSPRLPWSHFKKSLLSILPPQFAIIGWSMGGLFATRLAIEEPVRVSHLFSIASSPFFVQDNGWPGISKENLDAFRANLQKNPVLFMQQFMSQCCSIPELAVNKSLPPLKTTPHSARHDIEALIYGLDVLTTWDLRKILQQLSCPSYYLFGKRDTIVPRTVLKVLQKNYPNEKAEYVIFSDAAHDPFITEPERFIKEIERFMS